MHALLVPIRDERRRASCPASASRTAAPSSASTASTTAASAFDHVRVPRDALLDRYAQVDDDGTYFEPDREPDQALLHDARHADPGPRQRLRRVDQRDEGRARHRRPPRRWSGASSARPAARRRCCWTTAPTSAGCCPRWPRPTRCTSPRSGSSPSCTRSSPTRTRRDRERRELETLAAGLKAVATWHATETIQACREACGGAGYLRANRFAALKADTDVFTTFEGDNTVLLQLAAKNLLTDYRDQFGELDPLGAARRSSPARCSGTLAERDRTRAADDLLRPRRGHLLDRDEQLDAAALAPGAHPRGRRAAPEARDRRRPRRRSTCSSTARTTSSPPPAPGSTASCSRRSPTRSSAATDPALAAGPRPPLRPVRARARSRPSAAGSRSTAGSSSTRSKAVIKAVNALCARAAPARRPARRRLRRAGAGAGRRGRRWPRCSSTSREPAAARRARAPDARRAPARCSPSAASRP